MNDCFIELCDEKHSKVYIHVDARIGNGCLSISGQDCGEAVSEVFGDSDYEYWYDFDLANTKKLFSLLSDDETTAREIFVQKFSGSDGCKSLREFCEANGVEYKSFSY